MKILQNGLTLTIAVFFHVCSLGDITVDTRHWSGTGDADGFSFTNLPDPYSDGAAKINLDSSISSPVLHGLEIHSVSLELRCSSTTPSRLLRLTPFRNSVPLDPITLSRVSAKDKPENLSASLASLHADSFTLSLAGSGNTGVWGLYSITVFTTNSLLPYSLRPILVKPHGFTAVWSNSPAVHSNEFSLVQTNFIPFHAVYDTFYGLDSISNRGGNPKDITDSLPAIYPALSGKFLYAPTNSTGELMIGNGNHHGFLLCHVAAARAGFPFVFRARRHTLAGEGSDMPIYTVAGGVTNPIASVSLGEVMENYVVSVPPLAAGDAVMLHSSTNRTRNGRVIVDCLGFAESVVSAHVETNAVEHIATYGDGRCRVEGLSPEEDYLWSVRGFDAAGGCSPFPALVPVKTDRLNGLIIQFK